MTDPNPVPSLHLYDTRSQSSKTLQSSLPYAAMTYATSKKDVHLSRNSGHSFRKSISRTHKRVSIIIFLPCRTTNIAPTCSTARQLPRRLLASLSLSLVHFACHSRALSLSLTRSPAQCEFCLRSLSYRHYRLSLRRGHDGGCGQKPPTRKEQQQQQQKSAHRTREPPTLAAASA